MFTSRKLIAFALAAVVAMGAVSCDKDESNDNTSSDNGEVTVGDWVNLGLPSGLLWASRNIGAAQSSEDGLYFAWGETQSKTSYSWSNYAHGSGYADLTKYCNNENFGHNGYTDNLTILQPADDAATANWGNGARTPTKEEFQELCENCTSEWITLNGRKGRKFTGSNGNSIFIPAAGYLEGDGSNHVGNLGYYWSATLRTDGFPNVAWQLYINQGNATVTDASGYHRYYGLPVRAVRSAK